MFMAREKETLQAGTKVLGRLETDTLPVACFHPYLQKVRGRLKAERKTDFVRNWDKDRPFEGGCLGSLFA